MPASRARRRAIVPPLPFRRGGDDEVLRWLGGLVLVLAAVLGGRESEAHPSRPAGSESARRLAPGPHPLVVYSHGFMSMRPENVPLAEPLRRNLEARGVENPFANLGGPEDGIVIGPGARLPCAKGAADEALSAGRQLMITRLAALALFESRFAKDGAERASQETFLRDTLARDFPEASFEGALRG